MKTGQTAFLLRQPKHGDDIFIFCGFAPSAEGNPPGQVKIPAYLPEGLQRHILKDPLFCENGPRADLAFERTVGGDLNLEGLEILMLFLK
jgi:hypothetical protein